MKRLLFFLLIAQCCFSQNVDFADAITGVSIENINVYIPSKNITLSAKNGVISISNYPKNNQFIGIAEGYEEIIFTRKLLKILSNTIFLQPKKNNLDEVVVSHSKWKEKRIDIPKKTSLLSAADIFAAQPQTAADAINKGSNIFVQKSQLGGGSPIIRGLSTNRILLSVDGVRMNNAIFRSGNVQNIISVDPFIISQAEIIHGAGSVVYGSDAIGGVINFNTLNTKKNTLEKAGKLVQRFSSANRESTSHVQYALGKNKWKSVSSLSYSRFGNLTQGKHGPDEFLRKAFVVRKNGKDETVVNKNPREQVNTGYQQYNLFQKISFEATKNHQLNFTGIYTETSNYDRYDRLQEVDELGAFKFAEWFYGPQKWLFLNLKSSYQKQHLLFDKINTSIAYQFFQESRNQRRLNTIYRINNTEKVAAYNFNIDAIKKFDKLSLNYGIEIVHNLVSSSANRLNIDTNSFLNDVSLRYPNGSSWNSFAIYTSSNFNINSKNKLSAGFRYNYITTNAKFDDPVFTFPFDEINIANAAVNGNIGWLYKISNKWRTTTFLSTAFRAPNIDDIGKIFQSSEPGALVVPNPNLKPETAYSVESNFIYNTSKLQFTISPYFTFLDNALSRNSFSFNGLNNVNFQGVDSEVTSIQNSNSQRIYGVDLDAYLKLTKSLSANFNYHYIQGEEKLANREKIPVRHVTPNFGNLGLRYQKNRFEINPYINFSQSLENAEINPREQRKTAIFPKDKNGLTFSPSWYTININSQIILTKDLKLSLNFENITNQRYRTYSSGVSAPGFNVITALQMKF